MKTIIFVCHGNICRSPAAEFICKKMLKEMNLLDKYNVYSRAVSYEEIGNDIYPPMKRELNRYGIPFTKHYADIISQEDYNNADYIFIMDESNKRLINRYVSDNRNIIKPIYCFTNTINEIEDPWYSGRYSLVIDELIICIKDILKNISK